MSFLMKQLLTTARQTSLINSMKTLSLRSISQTSSLAQKSAELVAPSTQKLATNEESKHCVDIFNKVNQQLAAGEQGRLFAVVHLCGKQFKVTPGDIILVEGYWPPTIGDKIRLEKVLLAGGLDFTLIGRPILDPGLVDVKATIIEKTLTHTKTHFKKKRRKQYTRINFQRSPNTMIRINSIDVTREVGAPSKNLNDTRAF